MHIVLLSFLSEAMPVVGYEVGCGYIEEQMGFSAVHKGTVFWKKLSWIGD